MPIHFRCRFCNARLSVSSRKAGARAKCPKCGEKITVPSEDTAPAAAGSPDHLPAESPPSEEALPREPSPVPNPPLPLQAAPAAEPAPIGPVPSAEPAPAILAPVAESAPMAAFDLAAATAEPASSSADGPSVRAVEPPPVADPVASPTAAVETDPDPYAEFLVYDVDTEIVYEDRQGEPVASGPLPFDPDKVAVRRGILYVQGALLGMVALVSFGLGILLGASGSRTAPVAEEPRVCEISGRIVLLTRTEAMIPDQGAVAIVLPQGARPEAKWELVGLRPQDRQAPEQHPALREIRDLGGDHARADSDGRFRLRVSDRGNYYLLVISASRRNPGAELPRTSRAQLGRFFQLAPDLFGGYDHRWEAETVRGDRELNFTF